MGDPGALAGILAVYVVAGIIKGAMGFGLPLVAVAILPFFASVEMALALNALIIPLTNIQQIRQSGVAARGQSGRSGR